MNMVLKAVKTVLMLLVTMALIKVLLMYYPHIKPWNLPDMLQQRFLSIVPNIFSNNLWSKRADGKDRDISPNVASKNEQNKLGAAGSNQTKEPYSDSRIEYDYGEKSDNYFLTYQEMLCFKNIGTADKLAAYAMVSRLKGEEIDRVWYLAQDGITYGEYEEIKAILMKYLNSSEMDKINDIMSKGRKLYTEERQEPH